ncbi:DM13 domain-containing protein [soil metagenome]
MNKLFLILAILLSVSCNKDESNTPTKPVNSTFDPMATGATLLKQGTLTGVGHSVSGTAKIYNDVGKKILVLDPFSAQNGPDLKIYLSTDQNATKYINLGPLMATSGKQTYDVAATTDLDQYKYVLVWCQQFSVLFGKSELQ